MIQLYAISIIVGLWFNHRAKRAGNTLAAWLGLAPICVAAWHYIWITAWT